MTNQLEEQWFRRSDLRDPEFYARHEQAILAASRARPPRIIDDLLPGRTGDVVRRRLAYPGEDDPNRPVVTKSYTGPNDF